MMKRILFLFLLLLNVLAPVYPFAGNESASTPSGVVVIVTDSNFRHEVLDSRTVVLVHFWAAWSGPSRKIAPVLEAIAKDYEGRVKVAKLNVDENDRTTQRYNIRSLPTLIVFKNGAEQKRLVGPTITKDQITRTLERYLHGNG